MEINEFLAQYPEAKEKPEFTAVKSLIKKYHWDKSEKADNENAIILMDFIDDYNHLVREIKNHEESESTT